MTTIPTGDLIAALTIITNTQQGWRTEIVPPASPTDLIAIHCTKDDVTIHGYGETLELAVADAAECARRELAQARADLAAHYHMPDRTMEAAQ